MYSLGPRCRSCNRCKETKRGSRGRGKREIRGVEEQAKLADAAGAEGPVPKRNRGQFVAGDRRINRRGRPVGADAAARRAAQGKPVTGPVQALVLAEADLCHRLKNGSSFWVQNLPADARIVDAKLDPETQAVVLIVYSESFSPVLEGQPVPRFEPEFYGMKWRRPATAY